MSQLRYRQEYPKDSSSYDYAYIRLEIMDGCLLSLIIPLSRLLYQVVDEDSEEPIYNSTPFRGGYGSRTADSEYDKVLNYMIQNGWEEDGWVYSSLKNTSLPRYRKQKIN